MDGRGEQWDGRGELGMGEVSCVDGRGGEWDGRGELWMGEAESGLE